MGSKITRTPLRYFSRDEFAVFDDFDTFVDGEKWTIFDTPTSASVTHEGSGRGRMKLFASVDNEDAAIATTHELFRFVANKAMVAEASIQFTQIQTSTEGIAFGFADAFGDGLHGDDAAGIVVNDSAALIYKLSGAAVWRFHTEVGGTVVDTVSVTATDSGNEQNLRIEITPRSSTVFNARPFVDGVQLRDSEGVPIRHDVTIPTSTDMDLGLYLIGGHVDDTTLYTDYLFGSQVR